MKRIFSALVAVFILTGLFTAMVFADSSKAMVVTELSTGAVLSQKNADTRLPMASTTKIMTALVTLENAPLDALVKVPDFAARVEGSSMYLVSGETLTVKELLYGLMLTSGNDAAEALAYFVGKNNTAEFVKLMNDKAKALGLTDTHFTNPSGLPDDNHYTTAKELAVITAAALENPVFKDIVNTKSFSVSKNGKEDGRTLINHNKLLSMYDFAIGVKTGFTKKAGRCLVSAAQKDSVTLICVTLNDPDDWQDHISAYEKGFERTCYTCLAKKGELKIKLSTPSGELVSASNTAPLYAVIIDGKTPEKFVKAQRFVYAPKKAGDSVGQLCYRLEEKTVAASDICLDTELTAPVKKELFITTIIKYIRNLF